MLKGGGLLGTHIYMLNDEIFLYLMGLGVFITITGNK